MRILGGGTDSSSILQVGKLTQRGKNTSPRSHSNQQLTSVSAVEKLGLETQSADNELCGPG